MSTRSKCLVGREHPHCIRYFRNQSIFQRYQFRLVFQRRKHLQRHRFSSFGVYGVDIHLLSVLDRHQFHRVFQCRKQLRQHLSGSFGLYSVGIGSILFLDNGAYYG
ncbi:hypothetical protein RQP46_007313 [Phenoliferia psychrophenolica]